jgi:hypothetical protein
MDTTYIDHIPSPSSPSIHLPPTPTGTHSGWDLFTFLSTFLKVYIDSSSGFHHGISHIHIQHFNQINTLHYLLILYFPAVYYSTTFSKFCYTIFIYRCNLFQYYSLSIIPLPLPPSPLRQTHYYNMYMYAYKITMYLCIQLPSRFSFHIWGKSLTS